MVHHGVVALGCRRDGLGIRPRFGPEYDQRETIRADLDLIRSLPGVVAASSTSGIPLSGGGSSTQLTP